MPVNRRNRPNLWDVKQEIDFIWRKQPQPMTISVALMIRKLPPGATVGQIATRPVDRRLPIRIVGRRHCDAFSLSKSRAAGENRFSRSTDVSCYIAESLVFHFRRSRCEGGLDVPSSPALSLLWKDVLKRRWQRPEQRGLCIWFSQHFKFSTVVGLLPGVVA